MRPADCFRTGKMEKDAAKSLGFNEGRREKKQLAFYKVFHVCNPENT